jgi:hypothetical protein
MTLQVSPRLTVLMSARIAVRVSIRIAVHGHPAALFIAVQSPRTLSTTVHPHFPAPKLIPAVVHPHFPAR